MTSYVGSRPIPDCLAGCTPIELFNAGYDTFDIAAYFRISEDSALRLVCKQRSAALGLSDPYEHSRPASAGSAPRQIRRVAYAGRA